MESGLGPGQWDFPADLVTKSWKVLDDVRRLTETFISIVKDDSGLFENVHWASQDSAICMCKLSVSFRGPWG